MERLKEYLKNLIRKLILDHKVKLHSTDDSLIFNVENIGFFGEKYLLIKHRDTGKRISKPIKNSNVQLYDYELEKMNEFGIFDIYLKVKSGKFEFVERTKYESINKNKNLINRNDETIFRSYKTVEAGLSFSLRKASFSSEITFSEFNNAFIY